MHACMCAFIVSYRVLTFIFLTQDKHSPENYVLHIEEALDYLKANVRLNGTLLNMYNVSIWCAVAEDIRQSCANHRYHKTC